MIDHERWRRVASGAPEWDERSRLVASLVNPGERVLDIGAGARGLRAHLPEGCSYTPVDCVPGPDVIVLDIDQALPDALPYDGFDVAVLAGVLEYLDDPGGALWLAARWARRVIASYAVCEAEPLAEREQSGWRNHFTAQEFQALCASMDLLWSRCGSKGQIEQAIYVVNR